MTAFTYLTFEVEIERKVDAGRLGWPGRGAADTESGLGCNRSYIDLRRFPWSQAKRVYACEEQLIARIVASEDREEECEVVEEELYEDAEGIYGLDIGIASTVVALSAAGCVPFSSCNAGAFGGSHYETHPVVAFYGRAEIVELLLHCAEKGGIGLCNQDAGHLIVYATDIRHMRNFANALIQDRAAFRTARALRHRPAEANLASSKQLKLL